LTKDICKKYIYDCHDNNSQNLIDDTVHKYNLNVNQEFVFCIIANHDIFKISAQLAEATNVLEEPFGGMKMIFAGDFTQLQCVIGIALYSTDVGTKLASRMSVKKQEETNRQGTLGSDHNCCNFA
jgi:hypothetical protein